MQASLKKGGADADVVKALRYLLATPEEVQQTEKAGQSMGQWLSDILKYRQIPTAMTPFDYITLSDATERKGQEVSQLSGLHCVHFYVHACVYRHIRPHTICVRCSFYPTANIQSPAHANMISQL